MSRSFKVSLIQMSVGREKLTNLRTAEKYLCNCKDTNTDIAVLPEMFNCPYDTSAFPDFAEPIPDGETCMFLSEQARKHKMYIVGGSIPEKYDNKIYNTATLWGPDGELLLTHRKVHLFDISVPGGISFKESDILSPGSDFKIVDTPLAKIGLAVCYDLRFPESFRSLTLSGAELIIVPASFNTTTGPAHWDIILRTRAVENTVYVAACASAPHSDVSYPAWGHSMLIDPFGWIIKSAGRNEEVISEQFNSDRLDEVRKALPVLNQLRPDTYKH